MKMYFDGHATTPLAPEAREAMVAAWRETANPHSDHLAGAAATAAIDGARVAIAKLVGAEPGDLVLTSGATESNNLAILGTARRSNPSRRNRLVVSAIEHKAVLEPAGALRREGFDVVFSPVDSHGRVELSALQSLVDDRTLMLSIMAANNETGVIQPVKEAAAIARKAGVLIHCDAAQAAGKLALDVLELDVDYMSISSHKMYGPFGVGALYIAENAPRPAPLMFGGGQQGGLRPGTMPTPLCVGFGAACRVAASRMVEDAVHCRALRSRFVAALKAADLSFDVLGEGVERLPGSVALLLHEVDSDALVDMLGREMTFSTGSACTAGQTAASHVLTAMGLTYQEAKSFIRLFFGRYNSESEADRAASLLKGALARLRLVTGGPHQ